MLHCNRTSQLFTGPSLLSAALVKNLEQAQEIVATRFCILTIDEISKAAGGVNKRSNS